MSKPRLCTDDRLRNKLLRIHNDAQNNPNKTLEETITYVDAVIKLTEARIDRKNEKRRRKRFHKNAVRPVMRLPEEIMVLIFGLLVNAAGSASANENSSESEPWWDWLIITKICQSWRNIAIFTPSLWTGIINFSHVDKIQTFLSRSQNAHIDVVLRSKGVKLFIPKRIIDLFVGHMERVRSFEVIASSHGKPKQWNLIWNLLASASAETNSIMNLKRMELRDISEISPWVVSEDINDIADSLPPRFHLQELRIKKVLLPWTSPLLRGLSVLSMRYSGLRYHDITELLDVLDTCPNLLSLELCGVLLTSTSRPKRTISLPQLRSIDITINFNTCIYFIDCIISSTPTPAELEWEIFCVDYPFTNPVPFLPKLLDSGARCCNDVSIYCCDDTLKLKTSDLSKSGGEHPSIISSAIFGFQRPEFDTPDEDIQSLFSTIETIISQSFWSNLTRLSFRVAIMEGDTLAAIRKSHWLRFLALFPNIQYLSIEFPPKVESQLDVGLELGFMEALLELINPNRADEAARMFSKLTCLRLNCANFSSKTGRRARRMFLKYLTRRGKRLRNLIVDRCIGLDANELQRLGIAKNYKFM